MPAEITMPQQSDTMTEGTVVKWHKKEGEKVKAGEIIAEIETDKAVMEMEAFQAGTLAAILVKEGEKVPVGTLSGADRDGEREGRGREEEGGVGRVRRHPRGAPSSGPSSSATSASPAPATPTAPRADRTGPATGAAPPPVNRRPR